jgi:hypothetical protein
VVILIKNAEALQLLMATRSLNEIHPELQSPM